MRIISGEFKNRQLLSPKSTKVRPTQEKVREAIFSRIGDGIIDSTFLDLCSGSGAMGLEAISRGAKQAVFVENDREALKTLKQNIHTFSVETKAILHPQDIIKLLPKLSSSYDYIFFDPPYDNLSLYQEVIGLIDHHQLLAPQGELFIEERLENPPSLPSLEYLEKVETRRYGSTQISRFKKGS
jgi:16S rRNA (guanine966-N2)-methyltransferase